MANGAKEFRDTERRAWNSVAGAWHSWWHKFEAAATPLSSRLLALAGVARGHRLLDVGCGIGEPALSAARMVGPTGHVLATDLAPDMLTIARKRSVELGLANVSFVEADATELAIESEPFDAATSRWGLMLMSDPVAAVAGVRAVLRPGARFAAAVWTSEAPFLSLPRKALQSVLGSEPPDPSAPGPFRLADPDEFRSVLTDGGLEDVTIESVDVTFTFANADEYSRFIVEMSSRTRAALEQRPPDVRARAMAAVQEAAAEFAVDSAVVFRNRSWCASGVTSDG